MPRPRKPYVQRETTRHGKVVWYFRKGDGPRIRLRGEYENEEWLADYEAALGGQRRTEVAAAPSGTLAWLIERYYDSLAYTELAEATKRQRKSIFNRVLANAHGARLSQITPRVIAQGRDDRSATPAAAVCFVKAMRGLFGWALEAQHISADPTAGIVAADPKTDGHHTWTVGEVRQYQARWPVGTRERLAMEVMLNTGMRPSDAIEFGRQHVKNGIFDYRSIKTGVEVVAPVLPPLAEAIAAMPPSLELTFILTEFGRPFSSVNSFGNWFRKRCKTAGVPGRAHGLRKAGATIAAENGASDRELMALFGWTTERQAGVYTRRADRARLARQAAEKLKAGTSIPAPHDPVRGSGRKT